MDRAHDARGRDPAAAGQIGLTERLDRWATHPFWGVLILAGILGLAFWLTYSVGPPQDSAGSPHRGDGGGRPSRRWMVGAPAWLSGLVATVSSAAWGR